MLTAAFRARATVQEKAQNFLWFSDFKSVTNFKDNLGKTMPKIFLVKWHNKFKSHKCHKTSGDLNSHLYGVHEMLML
jgi:hypothetical protein